MKKLYFLLFIQLVLGCGADIHFPYNEYEPNYNGGIKTVEQIRYETVRIDENPDKVQRRVLSYFDEKGNSIKDFSYNSENVLVEECVCIIYNKGLEKENICIGNNDTLNGSRAVYKYDKKGRKLSYEFYWGNKFSGKREFKYENNGVDYTDYGYDKNNQLEDKTLILHDKKGRKVKTVSYVIPTEEEKGVSKYYYDKKGNEISYTTFRDGQKKSANYKSYDRSKNILYMKNYYFKTDNDSTLNSEYKIHYEYDSHKNVISELIIGTDEKYLTKKIITYY
jgi:hypothetical protein